MKKLTFIMLGVLLFGATASLAQDVRYDFDRDKDFSKYKTYKWVTVKEADQVDELTAKQITNAVDAELSKKGLEKTDQDSADLYLAYETAIDTEKQFTSYSTDWGYGSGWYRGGWYGGSGMGTTTGQTSTIYNGQLALDMYDTANHSLVWRGVASKTIDPKAKPEKQQKNLEKTVAKLLKNYPPAVKK